MGAVGVTNDLGRDLNHTFETLPSVPREASSDQVSHLPTCFVRWIDYKEFIVSSVKKYK